MNKYLVMAVFSVALCNMALCKTPKNVARDATASSNSEFKKRPLYLASNVIDGDRSNEGHGPDYLSWGPDLIDDPWLQLDWDKPVEVEEVIVYIRCDFPPYQPKEHDSWWKSGTIELSTGMRIPFQLKKTSDPQSIVIPRQTIEWLRFTDLVPDEKKWCGFCEVEVMDRATK